MKNIGRNTKRVFAASLIGNTTLKIKASEEFSGSNFFAVQAIDLLLHNGAVGDGYDIYFYKNNSISTNNAEKYNRYTHTSFVESDYFINRLKNQAARIIV